MEIKYFTPLENDLLEALIKQHLTGTEWDAAMTVIRYTKGFHREYHSLSLNFIVRATGRHKTTVFRALCSLRERNIVSRNSAPYRGGTNSYRINPPEKWVGSSTPISADEPDESISTGATRAVSVEDDSMVQPDNHPVSALANQERKVKESDKESGKESGGGPVPFSKDKNSEETSEDRIHRAKAPISPVRQIPSYVIDQAIINFNNRFFESSRDLYYRQKSLDLKSKERLKCKRWVKACDPVAFARQFARIIESMSPNVVHCRKAADLFMEFVKLASQCCKT
jgi:phage replication O-like protein O